MIPSNPLVLLLAAGVIAGCSANNTHSDVTAPGAAKKADTVALDSGAALLQSRPPIDALNAYLDGFHFYNGHIHSQMEAHHYCSILNEEVIQCVIYDGNVKDAKLMGVEYIISERLYAGLPPQEQALWHSHMHEVKSGQLVAPGIPGPAEHALMDKLVHTYGKTWHTWHTDLDKTLPLGVPQLMMGFTADGQADPAMVSQRDSRLGIDSAEEKRSRADIVAPPVNPAADAWQHGKVVQLADPTGQQHDAMPSSGGTAAPDPAKNAHSAKP
ncbi:OBAP family protein [Pseudomonas sp. RIT-PI-S]|uniref:OBAP family protein n=1 Tax=Pseudomonas sp. RIT-PI-S TaxID=3035295 RepID=UPI0021D940F2|nr:OBAP family protein [Pseudomonas sp. RIT-PI-S]